MSGLSSLTSHCHPCRHYPYRRRRFVIVGGGPVGWATAVHLGRAGYGRDTTVVERDDTYTYNSACRSAGGIRQQFSLRENIAMSMYSARFLEQTYEAITTTTTAATSSSSLSSRLAWKRNGYMFLAANDAQASILRQNNVLQRSCGAHWIHMADNNNHDNIESLLRRRYPWLQTNDLVAASFSGPDTNTQEGYLDPWALLQGMKQEAVVQHGVEFLPGHVDAVTCQRNDNNDDNNNNDAFLRIESVHVRPGKLNDTRTTTSTTSSSSSSSLEIKGVEALINCAGPWAQEFVRHAICKPNAHLLSTTQRDQILHLVPIERRKRCIFFVHCPGKQQQQSSFSHPVPTRENTPLTIDPTGVYFRPEGSTPGNFICGVSPPPDKDAGTVNQHDDNDNDDDDDKFLNEVDYELFDQVIWPTLAYRVPAFHELRVQSAWSGYYDYNTLDQNAILGFHPAIRNLMCAGGFSGHGLQMAPAAGRAVTELLLYQGKFQTLDLSNFSFERIQKQEPYWETGIV